MAKKLIPPAGEARWKMVPVVLIQNRVEQLNLPQSGAEWHQIVQGPDPDRMPSQLDIPPGVCSMQKLWKPDRNTIKWCYYYTLRSWRSNLFLSKCDFQPPGKMLSIEGMKAL